MAGDRSKKNKISKQRAQEVQEPTEVHTLGSPTKKRKTAAMDTVEIHDQELQPFSPMETPFKKQTTSLYVPLAAISMTDALPGLCAQHLSSLILTYYPPVRGTVLAYENVRISETPLPKEKLDRRLPVLAVSVDESPSSFIWLTADFLVFRPAKDVSFEGYVNVHNQSHLGLLCYNLFNVSIPASRLPKDWSWIWVDEGRTTPPPRKQGDSPPPSAQLSGADHQRLKRSGTGGVGEGYFRNAAGQKVEGLIEFRVRDVETAAWSEKEKSFMGVEGTLLSKEEDKVVDEAQCNNNTAGHSRTKNIQR